MMQKYFVGNFIMFGSSKFRECVSKDVTQGIRKHYDFKMRFWAKKSGCGRHSDAGLAFPSVHGVPDAKVKPLVFLTTD